MSRVVLGMSVSLDGIAGPEAPDADGMAVFAAILGWQFPLRSWRAQQGQQAGDDSVDSGENPPFHAPVFVVTHRGQERIDKGDTSYTFVTAGLGEAVSQARAAADGKDVLLAGGISIAKQALEAGLADEVVLHVVPRLVGRGVRLFGAARADLSCAEAVQGEGAVHLRYRIR
jgi:dihydrofolate reductase